MGPARAGVTAGGAARASVIKTGLVAGGSMLLRAGAGPALTASQWVVRSLTVRSGISKRVHPLYM